MVSMSACSDPAVIPPAPADAGPSVCSLLAEVESTPGFPLSPQQFRDDIWPLLFDNCATAGCHLAPNGSGNFALWPVPDGVSNGAGDDACAFAESFNAVYSRIDFRNDPKNSRIYAAVDGSNPDHLTVGDDILEPILDYAMSAYTRYIEELGAIDPVLLFDAERYRDEIHPALVSAGCLAAQCHAPESAAAGFALIIDLQDEMDDDDGSDDGDGSDDTALDAGITDAGLIDAGLIDAGLIDASPADAGVTDAGPIDAGPIDAGPIDAGPDEDSEPSAIEANLRTLIRYIDFTTGQDGASLSRLYVRATDDHRQTRFSTDQAAALLSWITDGLPPGDEAPPPGCAEPERFDQAIFAEQIMPVLTGDIDWNEPDSGRNTTGCTRGPCHATDRGPGTLLLDPDLGIEHNLGQFACFVDLGNPSQSQILVCPIDDGRCTVNPHPGENIFSGVDDLNFQRLLSYLFAARNENTPLDFAYFARRVNPLLDRRLRGPDAAPEAIARSCSEVGICHGIQVPGDRPGNFSNLGLLPEAARQQELLLNFAAAANFIHFSQPDQSSLLLYPSNEIANLDNPLATGLPHPGGQLIAVDSEEADILRTWAGGLRPDGEGFIRHWLVAGDFSASRVTDTPILDEAALMPQIFAESGQSGSFNGGLWDGYFAEDGTFIDLDDAEQGFFRADPGDRMVYAVAYLINASDREIETVVTVRSPNDVHIYIDDVDTVALEGQGTTAVVTLPPYTDARRLVRLMVKVFQDAATGPGTDAGAPAAFGFDLQLRRSQGAPLTDSGGEIIIKLGPTGGV